MEPDNHPHARRTDPHTSHDAAASISVDQLRESQRHVLDALQRLGPASTDDQLVDDYQYLWAQYGWCPQSPSGIRTRRRELADMGLVIDTGERRVLVSGRKAIVWAAVTQIPDALF